MKAQRECSKVLPYSEQRMALGGRLWNQFFPLLDLRVDCLLLFASFLAAGCLGDDSSVLDRLDPLLGAGSSGRGCLDLLFVASFSTAGFSGDDLLGAGRLPPLLVIFLTAGVLGFFAGAALLTGVALGDSFLDAAGFLALDADFVVEDATFLAGDLFEGLPLAFD